MSGPNVVMVIRHGEKQNPLLPGSPEGVDGQGRPNPHSLTPIGWQRARGLAGLLAAPRVRSPFAQPTQLFAPAYDKDEAEHRPYQTLMPLAAALGATIRTPIAEDDEAALAALLAHGSGVALVSWEHHRIPAIAAPLAAALGVPDLPPNAKLWPDDDFWSALVFTATDKGYQLVQTSQALLPGDPPA